LEKLKFNGREKKRKEKKRKEKKRKEKKRKKRNENIIEPINCD